MDRSRKFLLWSFLMFCSPYPGWATQAEEMSSLEVKMTNIMDRMTKMEAEMAAKDQRITVLEDSLETKDQRIAILEVAMETLESNTETRDIQMCELEEEMKSLTKRIKVTEDTDVLLTGMVDQVRNPPFAFQCAWQNSWHDSDSVITYDRLTYDGIGGGSNFNVSRCLDINTGVFFVDKGFSGVWAVTFSIKSVEYNGEHNQAWLYINGEQIAESYHNAGYYDDCCPQYEGHVQSLGSRTLYMRLESGDTISLRSGTVGHGLYHITLCFQLAHSD